MTRIASFAHHTLITNNALEIQRRAYSINAKMNAQYKSPTYSGMANDVQTVVNLESQLYRIGRYLKNGETAKLRLKTMENAISNITDMATRLRSLLLQASSGGQAKDLDLPNAARSMLRTLKSSLNTRLDGRYLFAGANTDKAPVDFDRIKTPDLKSGAILRKDTAYFTGDQQKLGTRLDENLDLKYGVLADEDGFEALVRALKITEVSNDTTSLSHALKQVSKAITELPNIRARVGTDLANIEEIETQQKNFKVFAENTVTDMTKYDKIHGAALLAQETTTMQAAYKTIGILSKLSLVDYLR